MRTDGLKHMPNVVLAAVLAVVFHAAVLVECLIDALTTHRIIASNMKAVEELHYETKL